MANPTEKTKEEIEGKLTQKKETTQGQPWTVDSRKNDTVVYRKKRGTSNPNFDTRENVSYVIYYL